jgi:DNA polymerase-3 subunit delta
MMAERQVVIVKEAQDLSRTIDKKSYAENSMLTTVLVICYKYKLDKRKKATVVSKVGLVYESKSFTKTRWETG